jgi:hypothetical protein
MDGTEEAHSAHRRHYCHMAARTPEHITETRSRRIVIDLLPPDRFLERDQGERDYGIDLAVECFDDGEPSGAALLMQLKGTEANVPAQGTRTIPFDFRVDRLKRMERFSTPVLLAWCPVNAEERCFWFLWLQAYVAVVLDQHTPDWRTQTTVRLHIPIDNRVPSENIYARLRHIAGHPARTAQMGQLARIVHETPFLFDDPLALRARFAEALALEAIYGDENWAWARDQRRVVECGLRACEMALRGTDPTDDELREVGWVIALPGSPGLEGGPLRGEDLTGDQRFEFLAYAARHCASMLSNTVAVYFDDRLRHTAWAAEGDHDF